MNKQRKFWIALLLIGFLGQLAWVIENMYFNVFVYNTITTDVNVIARMVALSAVTATVTTLIMGALSDKIAKRKLFICGGYIVWGISVMVFAGLNLDNISRFFPFASAVTLGGWLAVILDCIMTFFGSTGNDAAFNAWVTDSTDKNNRARVEGFLATMPLIAMLVVFGLLDSLTQQGQWDRFFLITGASVSLGGLAGLFFVEEPQLERNDNVSCFSRIWYGFKPQVIKENRELYSSLLCMLVFSISTQIFMPYMIIYIQNYLGINDYSILLGVVLIASSVLSVLLSNTISKVGTDMFMLPGIGLLTVGLICMFFVRKPLPVAISAIVMMTGNLVVTAIINSLIRNYTPKDRAGQFQGIRMIFGVMLPMIIGPYIGAFVIKGSSQTYVELGEIRQVPTPGIWLAAAVFAGAIILPYSLLNRQKAAKPDTHRNLKTPFFEKTEKNKVLSEYPRPQMVRGSYLNLNGIWDFAVRKDGEKLNYYDSKILVPFAPETLLSGLNRKVETDDVLYYRRKFRLPDNFNEGLVHLHFGAVDQFASVYINDELVCMHQGGYWPFECDITPYLKDMNEIRVEVKDFSNTSFFSVGKQNVKRGGIWYTPTSGIWQTVWLESTPVEYIENLKITPDYDGHKVIIEVTGKPEEYVYIVKDYDQVIKTVAGGKTVEIDMGDFHSWSPEEPFLYGLTVKSAEDEVNSYFGMRKFSVSKDEKGIARIFLNNRPYFMKGVLDQGYWSDGYYTAPDDEAMVYDIQKVKEMGFNTIRKHIKIEPLRWYYHCDRLGMLVWQDMVSGGTEYSFLTTGVLPFLGITLKDDKYASFSRKEQASRDLYEKEMQNTVSLLYNTVSLALWVPFNEGWGQFDSVRITNELKILDATRLIDHASGWHDQKAGDLNSKHIYFSKIKIRHDSRVSALTEYGGYSWLISEHSYNDAGYGYRQYESREDLQQAFRNLHEKEIMPQIEKGLSAVIYTQLSDVEDEVNGLMTFDRQIVKYDEQFVREIMDKIRL